MKKLIVSTNGGIGDRLTKSFVGKKLADMFSRNLEILWKPDVSCPCKFNEMFKSKCFTCFYESVPYKEYILIKNASSSGVHKKLDDLIPLFKKLESEEIIILDGFHGHDYDEFECIRPIDEIEDVVKTFSSKFTSPTIGVHIRRSDKIDEFCPSIDDFIKCVENLNFKGSIFLATDDGGLVDRRKPTSGRCDGIVEKFISKFKNRIITYPTRSLLRESKVALIDSVIELFLLRKTDFVVGCNYSGFSKMAAAGKKHILIKKKQNI